MSKAFTKEDDSDLDADEYLDDEHDDHDGTDEQSDSKKGARVGGGKNYITPAGAARLKAELHDLLTRERPKLVEVVAWAAGNGDRSENADYIYGKRRLREIDRRIRFLQKRLDAALVVDPALQKGPVVLFGATVTVRDEDDREKVFRIVGVDETDAAKGKVSWVSPIGKVLLQTQVGDVVLLKTPKGDEELEVLKIEYVEI